jgi:CubicO group peptidase (beta-lactamase class C family)
MHRFAFARLFGFIGLAACSATPGVGAAEVIEPAALSSELEARIEAGQGVGIVTAIGSDGSAEYVAAGTTGGDDPVAVDETTLFEIGSISKTFTALLLAQLVLEDAVDLDAPITDYLPDDTVIPAGEEREITALDLATHTAGLPPIPTDMADADPLDPYAGYDSERLLAFLAEFELPRAPGTAYEYSNVGIALLGLAIETVTGTDYAELVETRILEPLGMDETVIEGEGTAAFAQPHDRAGTPIPAWSFGAFAPAGAWRSTAADMQKFIAAASGATETPLREAFDLMAGTTRPSGADGSSLALGWMILEGPGGPIVWHNGITGGSNAMIAYQAATGRTAVVLANQASQTGIEDIGFHIVDPDLPLTPQPEPREAITLSEDVLERYVGDYELAPGFVLTITRDGDRLFAQATGQQQIEIFAQSETEFFYRVVDAQLTFTPGEGDAPATEVVLHQNGQDLPGARVP